MPDTGHTFEAYLKRATTPLLVLQMLSEQPMYPYQIMQEVNKRSGGVYKMPLLYTVMDRLQQQGFVYESKKEISESNRVRNYYALTEAEMCIRDRESDERTATPSSTAPLPEKPVSWSRPST